MEKMIAFNGKNIRRVKHEGKWYFSVVDVIGVLTESTDAKDYWYRLKKRESEASSVKLSTFCRQLKLKALDGKMYATDCANTKSIFRIIQSIPSKKAEPFKRWLAGVGYERVQEFQDPSLAQERMRELCSKTAELRSSGRIYAVFGIPKICPSKADFCDIGQKDIRIAG